MIDRVSKEHRSWNMSRIAGKNTGPEIKLRSLLHRAGFRFRLHDKRLPGKPDIVLHKHRTVIFVNGCFWHRHPGCQYAYTPKSRIRFWLRKFEDTVRRDNEENRRLVELGWNVVVVWECELNSKPESIVSDITSLLTERAHGN